MRRDAQRLADIVQAAEIAQAYIDGVTREQFFAGGLLQDAVLRQLTILGEAAFKTSVELQQRHPTIPWSKIVGFRHRMMQRTCGLFVPFVMKAPGTLLLTGHRFRNS